MRVTDFKQFAGTHPETATLRSVFEHAGIVAPHTKKPFTEAAILGIGGGIGAGYFSFQYKGLAPTVFLAARHGWMDHVAYMKGVCDRLGVAYEIKQTGSAKVAVKNLTDALAREQPTIVWTDMALLPYYGLSPRMAKLYATVVVVFGYDEEADVVHLADRSRSPLTVTTAELATSRASFGKAKNRTMTVQPPKKLKDLKKAVEEGIKACGKELTTHRMRNMRVDAIEKWADLMASPKSKEGWPTAFGPGVPMHQGLGMAYLFIEVYGTGGGLLRPMFAQFLEEAAEILSRPVLREISADYATLGKKWSALARSMLPNKVAPLKETRVLLDRYEKLRTGTKGNRATEEILDVVQKIREVRAASRDSFPFDADAAVEFYAGLSKSVNEIYELECAALARLAKVVS